MSGGRGGGNGARHTPTRARRVGAMQTGWDGMGMLRPALPRDKGLSPAPWLVPPRPWASPCTKQRRAPTTGAAPRILGSASSPAWRAVAARGPRSRPSATPSQQVPAPTSQTGNRRQKPIFPLSRQNSTFPIGALKAASGPGRDPAPLPLARGTNF